MFELCVRWFAWGFDTSLKVAIVALVAAAVLKLLRLQDSNIRHRVWTSVLTGMLLLPILTPVVPALPLQVLPSPEWLLAWTAEPVPEQSSSEASSVLRPATKELPQWQSILASPASDRQSPDAVSNRWPLPDDRSALLPPTSASASPIANVPSQTTNSVKVATPVHPAPPLPLPARPLSRRAIATAVVLALGGVWLVVSALFALRLTMGVLMATRLKRASRSIDRGNFSQRHPGICVRECPDICVPLTVGWLRPQILLPLEWKMWPAEKLQAVLAHEQMHVHRADCLVALLAEINCCLYWFHPLAWWLKQQLSALAEQACDDAAIDSTGDRARYARHLLEVAAQVSRQRGRLAPAGVSMARRSHVETRIHAILDFTRPLARRLTWRSTLAILAVMVPLVALTAALKPPSGQQSSTTTTAPTSKAEKTARDPQPTDAPPKKTAPDTANAPRSLVCTGAVLDAAANPISGAAIYIVPQFSFLRTAKEQPARIAATSSASGRFEFTAEADEAAKSSGCMLLIAADGHAPEFRPLADCLGRSDFSVSLPPDDVTIRGRILTLEGQPVPDVKITVRSIDAMNSGDLTPFLDIVKAGNGSNFQFERSLHQPPHIQPTTTDADGRFNLRGIGPNRVAEIKVLGRSIQHALLKIMTRESEPIQARAGRGFAEMERSRGVPPLFGATFDWIAKPSRPITGTVVDSKTKQPLAGVGVGSLGEGHAKTDENGRFELLGCAKTATYRLLLGTSDPRYLSGSATVTDTPGLDPLETTLELTRGMLVNGRVIDKQTGKPVVHARVHYFPLSPNPNLTPGIGGSLGGGFGPFAEEYTDEAGHVSIGVLPGPGFIGVAVYGSSAYQSANVDPVAFFKQQNVPYAVDPPRNLGKLLLVATSQGGQSGMPQSNFHAVELLNAPAQDELQLEHDIELVPARQLSGTIVDPEGNPVEGVIAYGLANEFGAMETLRTSQFTVARLGDDEQRTVIFRYEARRLTGEINVTAKNPQPLRVVLQPWGEVSGRLLNRDGTPLASIQIGSWGKIKDGEQLGHLPGHHATDDQGRFQIIGLVPSLTYPIQPRGSEASPQLRVRLKPGEQLDAGDIKDTFEHLAVHAPVSEPPANAPPAPAAIAGEREASASRSAAETIRGRVVDARGKAVAGAKLHWFRPRIHNPAPMQPRLVATTNSQGDFHFVRPATGTTDSSETPDWAFQQERLVVTAPGHGFAFLWPEYFRDKGAPPTSLLGSVIQAFAGSSPPSISLPSAGEPIRGRLVNIDGQPVSGATIKIRWFDDITPDGAWQIHRKSKADDQNDWAARATSLINVVEPIQLRDVLPTAKTDASGRFELRDLGPNRLFQLLVTSDQTQSTDLIVRNQSGQEVTIPPDPNFSIPQVVLHPKDFVHAVGPSRPLTGRVLDLDTGEPIAGAVVRAYLLHGSRFHSSREREEFSARSAADGRYRLTGLPLGKDNRLVAFVGGDVPYIPVGHPVDTSQGPNVEQDFRLKRGLWATGRVYDAQTDQPFTGTISYYWFRNRDLERQIPGLFYASVDGLYSTNSKGEFRVPVLPSRGILAFNYKGSAAGQDSIDRFPRGAGAEAITGAEAMGGLKSFPTLPHYLIPGNYERIAEVNPEVGQADIRVDLPLYASQPVKIRIVDAGGKPVTGCQFYGVNDRWGWQELTSAEPAIEDLKAGERRKVIAFHRERNLGGGLIVKQGDPEPIEIKLVPAGRLTGRLLDKDGEPITDATLDADYEKLESDDRAALWADDPDLHFNPSRIPLDKNGRFQLGGLIPGWTYNAHASAHRKLNGQMAPFVIGAVFEGVQVEPGQTKDLGDLKIKPDSDEQEQEEKKTEPAAKADEKAPSPPANPVPAPAAAAGAREASASRSPGETIRARVVNSDGKAVAGAKIYWFSETTHNPAPAQPRVIATTDAAGDFNAPLPLSPAASRTEPLSIAAQQRLVVIAPGHGFVLTAPQELRYQTAQAVALLGNRIDASAGPIIALPPAGESIRGKLVNIDGQPIVGATVRIRWFDNANANRSFRPQGAPAADEKTAWADRVNFLIRAIEPVQLREILPTATTDATGHFQLTDLGANRLFQLLVQSDQAESKDLVVRNQPGEPITIPPDLGSRSTELTIHPREFVQALGPSNFLAGRVTDRDTGEPIAGAVIRAFSTNAISHFHAGSERQELSTRSDAQGRYRISGVLDGKPTRLVALATGDVPYIPISREADSSSRDVAAHDFRLQRGIWATGRVFDAETGEPFVGEINYFWFGDGKLEQDPGSYYAFVEQLHWTSAKGEFRVPILPTRGVLAFHFPWATPYRDGLDRYPRGAGKDSIDGHEKIGPRYPFQALPTHFFPGNYQRLVQIKPQPGQPTFHVDLPLHASPSIQVRIVDAQGQPVVGCELSGATIGNLGGRSSAEFAVEGLPSGERRKVFAFHRQRNLAGGVIVKQGDAQPVEIKLGPAGSVTGRLVDKDGEPITDGLLNVANWDEGTAGTWARSIHVRSNPTDIPVDKQGRFQLDGLIPGWNYSASVTAPTRFIGKTVTTFTLGNAFTNVQIAPGEKKDLGDLVVRQKTQDALDKKDAVNATASKPRPALRITGQTTTADGQPIAAAHVAAVGWQLQPRTGGDLSPRGEVLAEGISDTAGRFQLLLSGVSSKTHRYASLIARKDGLAIAWKKLDPGAAEIEASLKLSPDESLRGKFVDIEGRPAADLKLRVKSIMKRPGGDQPEGVGYDGQPAPAAWLPPIACDSEGRFTIRGIPPNHGVFLEIEATDRFAPQEVALNTGMAESRGERDATYRSLVRNFKPGEEIILPLAPAQIFEGTVRYDDTQEPAPHARLTIWASQQRNPGSMVSVAGQADAQGRYRIPARPGLRFGVTAYPPQGVPYLTRQTTDPIHWENGDRAKQVDLTLPRGVLVRGQVVAAGTSAPVAGASVQYLPQQTNNPPAYRGILTGWQGIQVSDRDGKFEIVVLPGAGRLVAHASGGSYVLQEFSSSLASFGKPGGQRYYAHAIHKVEPQPEADALDVTLELQPGASIAGRLVDEQGKAVDEALLVSRLDIWSQSLFWRGNQTPVPGRRFELSGLQDGVEYPTHFLDSKRRLGATVLLKASDPEPTVVLEPCGSATVRFVDAAGQPLADHFPNVDLVVTPGVHRFDAPAMQAGKLSADSDYVANIDRANYGNLKTDALGKLTLPALIPGATYWISVSRNGRFEVAKEFQVQPGQTLDLGDVVIPKRN